MDVSKEIKLIKSLSDGKAEPRVGIILGTGLSSISNSLKNAPPSNNPPSYYRRLIGDTDDLRFLKIFGNI